MGHGFRLTLQLVATVAAAAAVARATESARRAFLQAALDPPRHRAVRGRVVLSPPAPVAMPMDDDQTPAPAAPHAFGPAPVVPCRSIGDAYSNVIELEASGELDDDLSPADRLLALRHATDWTNEVRSRGSTARMHQSV